MNNNVNANFNKYPKIGQWIKKTENNKLLILSGKVEIGQGILFSLKQLVSDCLQISFDEIEISNANTDSHPNEAVTSGSLSIQDSGLTLKIVCANLLYFAKKKYLSKANLDDKEVKYLSGLFSQDNLNLTRLIDLIDDELLERTIDTTIKQLKTKTKSDENKNSDLLKKLEGKYIYINDLQIEGMLYGMVLHPRTIEGELNEKIFNKFKLFILEKFNIVKIVKDRNLIGIISTKRIELLKIEKSLDKYALWIESNLDVPLNSQYELWLKSQKSKKVNIFDQLNSSISSEVKVKTLSISRPFLTHASIGLCCAISTWSNEQIKVITHSQGIFNLRRDLAMAFDRTEEQITVSHHPGAGCYGHNGADDVAYDAAWLAQYVPDQALRVEWSRAQEMSIAPLSPAMFVNLTSTVDNNGKIISWFHEIWSQAHGSRPGRDTTPALLGSWQTQRAFPILQPVNAIEANGGGADRNSKPIYDIENIEIKNNDIKAMPLRVSALRSLGAHVNIFAIESMIDELAKLSSNDPIEFRLNHLKNVRAKKVLTEIIKLSNWKDKLNVKIEGHGKGIGFAQYKNTGAFCAVVAEVELTDRIEVKRLYISADVGSVVSRGGVINQLEGGAIQAISFTLFEETQLSKNGVDSNEWSKYPIIGFDDIPMIQTELIECEENPSLGAGECSIGPTSAAIANAVFDAIGIRLTKMPFNKDNLQALLLSDS